MYMIMCGFVEQLMINLSHHPNWCLATWTAVNRAVDENWFKAC